MTSKAADVVSERAEQAGGLVPKLRFPEFRDTGGWNRKALGAICEMKAGKFVAAADIFEKADDGFFPCFGGNGLRGYTKTYTHTGKFPLIGRQGALCGNINLGTGSFYATEHAVVVNTRPSVSVDWLYHLLIHFELNQYKTGQAQPGLSIEILDRLPCAVPSELAEQQKIAACLSSLDEVIAAEGERLAALKAHKNGLMQRLFPRPERTENGIKIPLETTPRLRFPEFQDAGDWVEKPLGRLAKNLDNRRIPITSSSRVSGPIPYYGASGIVDYVADYIFDEDVLCVSEDGANLIARSTPIAFSVSGKSWINNHAHVLKFTDKLTQSFVEQYLNAVSVEDFLTGVAQPKLNKAMLDVIPIPIPEEELELQEIAKFLCTVDASLQSQADKIETLKAHKTGLMQQLFPSPAEAAA
jgi:type I restriction enzyme, S subunit